MKRILLLARLLAVPCALAAVAPRAAWAQAYGTGYIDLTVVGKSYTVSLAPGVTTLTIDVTNLTFSSATLQSEYSTDNGASWTAATQITLNGTYAFSPAAWNAFRVRVLFVGTGGTAQVTARATGAPGGGPVGSIVSNAGTFPVQDNGASIVAVAAAAGNVGDAAWSGSGSGTAVSVLKAIYGKLAGSLTVTGSVSVSNLPATQAVTQSGAWTFVPATSGGLSRVTIVSAASNNLTTVKASAGQVYGAHCEGAGSATPGFLKFYDGAPTMGTTPAVDQMAVPAGSGHEMTTTHGIAFATGIQVAITAGIGLADNTAVAAGMFNCTVYFK